MISSVIFVAFWENVCNFSVTLLVLTSSNYFISKFYFFKLFSLRLFWISLFLTQVILSNFTTKTVLTFQQTLTRLYDLCHWQSAVFVFTKFDIQNSNYCTFNLTWRVGNGNSIINITVQQHMDLDKEYVCEFYLQLIFRHSHGYVFVLQLRSQKTKDDDAYSKLIFKTTLDACKALDGISGNFIVKMITETLLESASVPLKCPFKKLSHNFIIFFFK